MGASCTSLNCKSQKYKKQLKPTIIKRPPHKDLSIDEDSEPVDQRMIVPPDQEESRTGVYFQYDELIKSLPPSLQRNSVKNSRLEKWQKMITYGLDPELVNKVIEKKNKTAYDKIVFSKHAKIGLNKFYEANPKLFLARLCKGPPTQYRWLAWRQITLRRLKPAKGVYEELLTKGKDSIWLHDIMKDLDRTFPLLPFFDKDQYGTIGQKALMNILQAYSIYNEKVGYCQSMNFLVGFIMLMNGGNEKESFWFFCTLSQTYKTDSDYPKIEGIRGFYKKEFPLLQQYFYQFDQIFQFELPELHQHFSEISIPNLLWLQKWFQSLFLYSFPLGLCIRIWDNLLVFGTRYMFQVCIAILRLIHDDLMQLDIQGVNDYFKSFKDEDQGSNKLLPTIETIIDESYRVKIDQKWLDELKDQYKALQTPKQNRESERVGLGVVRQQAQENFEREQQVEILQQIEKEYSQKQLQEEEKIKMEDIQNESVDQQEDQQAQSSHHQVGGSSSGAFNADLSGVQDKKFHPQIINYEEQSRKSMKVRVHSTRNLDQRTENMSIHQSMKQIIDDIKLPPIHQNRNYMIFGAQQRELFDKSLTNKNSSDNFSITQSIHEAESEKFRRDIIRASSSSTHIHQLNLSNSGSNLPALVQQRKIINYKEKVKNPKVTQKNYNIYQQAHHHLLQRLKEQKQRQNSDDRVREESLEDIGDAEDDNQTFNQRIETSQNHHNIDESSDMIMIERLKSIHNQREFQSIQLDDHPPVQVEEIEQTDQEEEDQDRVGNMSQMGDQVSQSSMHRGQESDCLTDSNKMNIAELLQKRQQDGGINSDTIIHFVNNLPI